MSFAPVRLKIQKQDKVANEQAISLREQNTWNFQTGFDGINSSTVVDHLDGKNLTFSGSSALSTVYTYRQHQATLNGVDDYFRNSAWRLSTLRNKLSGIIWFKPASISTNDTIISSWNESGNQRSWAIQLQGTRKFAFLGSVNGSATTLIITSDTDPLFSTGTWNCFGWSYDGQIQTFSAYLNGAPINTTVTAGVIHTALWLSTSGVTIGAHFNGAGAVAMPANGTVGYVALAYKRWLASEHALLYQLTQRYGSYT